MIKFKNLNKACNEIGFNFEMRNIYLCVYDEVGHMLIKIFPYNAWAIDFMSDFNLCFEDEKAMLIKAITKDYEDYINED
ncbi:hypothetical protein WKS98_08510 [Lagierella sp. ICN-221743]